MSFVLPAGPCPAKIMLIGDAPSKGDCEKGMPFADAAGNELNRMLSEAGILRSICFTTNICRSQIPDNKVDNVVALRKKDITSKHVLIRNKYCLPVVSEGLELVKREIEMCQPNVILAFGNLALFTLTGEWGITKWRGSVLQCTLPLALDYAPKIIPIMPPSTILRQWENRPIAVADMRRALKESVTRAYSPPNYRFIIQPNYGETIATLTMLRNEADRGKIMIAADIETRFKHITCIGLAWSKLDAICIPLFTPQKPEGYWTLEEEAEITFLLYKILTHPHVHLVGQNFHYDAQYIHRYWHFIPDLNFDTMIAQHSCFSNMQKGLDFLSSMYCEFHRYWKDEGKEWDETRPPEENWTYNCKDCVITYEVAIELQKVIDRLGIQKVNDFQQSLYRPVLKTMLRGVKVNTALRNEFAMMLFEEISKREKFFIDVLGHPLNPRSAPQMQKLFYQDFGQKPVYKRITGAISCDDESLSTIAKREPLLKPLCDRISEYRSLGVFLSTFVMAPLGEDQRIRCSFKVTGTETYRFASSKDAFGSGTNLQNIPKGGEEAEDLELPNIRKFFIPDPGHTFFDIDLDSADLRIVCWEADVPEMKAMLREGKKIYVEVAREYHKDPTITKHHPSYKIFKSLCHGTNYLGTAKGLSGRLGLLQIEVEKIQKWYFGKFPEIRRWHTDLTDQVFKRRFVSNIFGYRVYFFGRLEGTIMNQAVAWIPQSTVGCLINRGYVNIHNNLKEVEVLLQVHDSLAGQFKTSLGDWAKNRIIEECSVPLPYSDPLTIPVGIKTSEKSWGDC